VPRPGVAGGGRRRKPMGSPAARSRRLTARGVQAQPPAVSVARSAGVRGGISAHVVALLTLAAFINYVDRGNLATAGPLIRD
jgi:hypothetical protein